MTPGKIVCENLCLMHYNGLLTRVEKQKRTEEEMGCTSSTEADSSANNQAGGNPQYNGGGYGDSSEDDDWRPPPLSEKEISDRIEAGKGSWKVPSANYTIQYGFQSQRGYYPEALDKNNQDSFLVKTEVGGNKNVGYFGVYDGHGSTGDKCSNFVRDKIIGLLKSTVGSTETDSAAFDEAYERAYLMCNQLLHREKNTLDWISC